MSFLLKNIVVSFFIFALFLSFSGNTQNVRINEFMASNDSTLADDDGDFEDWIELYNFSNEAIDLEGWGLSDRPDNPYKWVFPSVSIDPDGYLLLWASGKDRLELPLHSNFSINAAGEVLLLTDPQGNRISETTPLPLPTDISYGQGPLGNWFYFDNPTPGFENGSDGYSAILSPPELSHTPGFYDDSFYLKATHPDPQVVLKYTLDGSVPTSTSDFFPDSLHIYNRKNDPDQISSIPTTPLTAPEWYRWFPPMDLVFKGTTLRIKAFRDGTLSLSVKTASYWVDEDIFSRYSLPVISIAMNQQDLLGPDGIYTRFNMTGPAWERAMHIEYFEPNGTHGFSTDAGIRVHGGNSRRYALKSFRLYFRNLFGESPIDYSIFPEQQMNRHERLILRNAGSDWAYTYFRDPLIQNILHSFSDVETQAYRPAVVFLNGEYWGVMNIRERFDDNYIKNHYGYEEIDMLQNTGQVVYGSNTHYSNLITFLHNNSLESPENYEWVKTQMEVDDFRDYHILQIFAMNTDQPGKNVRFWRPKTPDGKWRWMWWDMDDSFLFGPHNNYTRNGLIYCTGIDSISDPNVNPKSPPPSWAPNGPVQTFPLRALLKSQEFRISFINRFADLLNTAFLPEYLIDIIDRFDQQVGDHLYEHYRRWHRPEPVVHQQHLLLLKNFAAFRKEIMTEHIISFFQLQGTYTLNLDIADGEGTLQVNTLKLERDSGWHSDLPWQGTYFYDIPFVIEAIAAPGYSFSHWAGDFYSNNPRLILSQNDDIALQAHFKPTEPLQLITFWYFSEEMPNDIPLSELFPNYSYAADHTLRFQSALQGYPFYEEHERWRKASMERRNMPTPLNYHPEGNNLAPYNPEDMRGIQIKQPFAGDAGENSLTFHLPSSGFENLLFSMAVLDEGAAESITIAYNVQNDDLTWINQGLNKAIHPINNSYSLISFDFKEIPQSNDNPYFKIRLTFNCLDPYEDEGNRVTFNNISLEGNPKDYTQIPLLQHAHQILKAYPNPTTDGILRLSNIRDFRIFDQKGLLLLQANATDRINVSGLPNGLYFLKTTAGEIVKVIIINKP